jgi:O-antigen/teichoic acid export membrane protein
MSLFDQLIVSGIRFLTIILIGRLGGAESLGAYALAMQLLALISVAQESLVSAPYTIFSSRYSGRSKTDFAGSVMLHACVQAGLVFAVMAGCSIIALTAFDTSTFGAIAWTLTLVTPLVLLREFARRFVFADMRMHVAVMIDATMASLQLFALLILTLTDSLTITAALWATGIASAIPGAIWLIYDRRRFTFETSTLRAHMRQNWRSGRWLFGSQFVAVGTSAALYSLLALTGGLATAGILAACMAIVQLANPILLGLANWLEPLTARAYAGGGAGQLRTIVQRVQIALLGVVSIFCAFAYLFGADLISVLYGNSAFADQRYVVSVLALSVLIGAAGFPTQFGLRAIERAHVVFTSKLIGTLCMAGMLVLAGLLGHIDVLTVAYALAVAPTAATIIQSVVFYQNASQAADGRSTPLATHKKVTS